MIEMGSLAEQFTSSSRSRQLVELILQPLRSVSLHPFRVASGETLDGLRRVQELKQPVLAVRKPGGLARVGQLVSVSGEEQVE